MANNIGFFDDLKPEPKKDRSDLQIFLEDAQVETEPRGREFIFTTPVEVSSYEDEWNHLMAFLPVAKETDTLTLKVGGFGGSVHLGVHLIHLLEDTKAKIKFEMIAPVYSMHAVLSFYLIKRAHKRGVPKEDLKIRPLSFAMFHDMSTFSMGKVGEIKKNIDHTRKWGAAIDKLATEGLLTKKEIKAIDNGEDLYLTADEILERVDKLYGDKDV